MIIVNPYPNLTLIRRITNGLKEEKKEEEKIV